MALPKKLSSVRNKLAKSLNEIPIRWGKYINHDMQEQKVIFVGHEKAIYDSKGKQLDEKIHDIISNVSGLFMEENNYAIGDYCIYEDELWKFVGDKLAGAWDYSVVELATLADDVNYLTNKINELSDNLEHYYSLDTSVTIPQNADLNDYSKYGNYLSPASSTTNTLTNCPFTGSGFSLHVERTSSSTSYCKQHIIENNHPSNEYWRIKLDNGWNEWQKVLAGNIEVIRINGATGKTFSSTLKNKFNNSVAFVAFDVNVPDNPFSFSAGYAIAFHSGILHYSNIFTLIGFDNNATKGVEVKMLDLRS